jgi:hypothetical protein
VADGYGAWTDRVHLETGAPPVRKGEYKMAGRLSLCLFSCTDTLSFFIFLADANMTRQQLEKRFI